MKYKYMTEKNSPFMAKLRQIRLRHAIEMEADPEAFDKKLRETSKRFFESLGITDYEKYYVDNE
ncbi:hypothetical protein SIO70_19340 [Chitinophaga sancti]|uniref:hypothetical protein n=1 Tax=Chitinophaga sancti TaxID=1004 RepID=UPI002A765E8B|nr:hypothetical protein [Chitinophaga sancti]WPQ60506.1 hypothetical protein SIO70_19340 [Chitinophaga sancti]